MIRRLLAIAIVSPLLLLAGCVSTTTGVSPAGGGGGEPTGVVATGDGWMAVFPDEAEQSTQPFPVPALGLDLEADLTVWETESQALIIQVIQFPDDLGDQGDLLLETAAASGDIVDSPALDSDGTFRGRDAVVVAAAQGDATVRLLAIIDGDRLYQLIHATNEPSPDHAEFEALAESFEFAE